MDMVLANESKPRLIFCVTSYLNSECELRLFVNDYTPVAGMTGANLTECSDGGYDGFVPDFDAPTLSGSRGRAVAPTHTWVFTHSGGDFTVYGYYWYDLTEGKVVTAQRADTPVPITGAGQTYSVTPKIEDNTL